MPKRLKFVVAALIAVLSAGLILSMDDALSADEHSDPAMPEFVLPRVPPKSPAEALASFEVADGFRIELVAAEPLVVDPVAMAFDEHGALFVVEMRDYSEQKKERLGRVRRLTDDDGDGQFDRSSVFVEGLSWPTAVACYDGGVFIGNAPDILYCKDTDGDGVADERRVVFTGFGRGNVQGLLNSFQWGLDQRIHGATSSAGGTITKPQTVRGRETRAQQPLELRGRDFAFDPKTLEMTATTGGGQHGLCFNRWGDRFVCSNSDHLQAIVFEERYLARNQFQSVIGARRSVAADGPQATVYRISPVEEWRIARTKLRVAGLVPGPIEGGGQPAGYFTSATGVTVYAGGLWGEEKVSGVGTSASSVESFQVSGKAASDSSWVYIADVGSNLIHRKRLVHDGATYRGERVDQDTEFVRSRDIWFRPVQMAIGPEGALYVADMYRETIEHPDSLPPQLKRQLDLTSAGRGRIYRIIPDDFKYSKPSPLSAATTAQLVESLDHPNMWQRTTALRLLYERHESSSIGPLRKQVAEGKRPEGRIAALYALAGLKSLRPQELTGGLDDPHPQVRRHALRLAEPFLKTSAGLVEKILTLVDDNEPVVQFQLALTLGECADARIGPTLADIIARNSSQRDVVNAALTSIGTCAGSVLRELLEDPTWLASDHASNILAVIVEQIVRQYREEDLAALVQLLSRPNLRDDPPATTKLIKALCRIPADALIAGDSPQMAKLRELHKSAAIEVVQNAQTLLRRTNATHQQRTDAISDLALGVFEDQRQLFEQLLSPQEPPEIRKAVLAAIANFDSPEVAALVLSRWHEMVPTERSQATELLLRREVWAQQLVQHLQSEGLAMSALDPGHVARLQNFPSDRVRKAVLRMSGEKVPHDRRQVFDEYRDAALAGSGDAIHGKLVFEKNCSTCHAVDARSDMIGPNLLQMVKRGRESTLFNILVPNGEVDPRFLEYVVLTATGEVVSGVIASETSTAVTIRTAENKTATILRVDIDELRNTGKSLMPEGFEKTIDRSAMADLLKYLEQAAAAGGNLP
jgi:putative membrane-bound dehydrogenase-like protein